MQVVQVEIFKCSVGCYSYLWFILVTAAAAATFFFFLYNDVEKGAHDIQIIVHINSIKAYLYFCGFSFGF